MNLMKCAMDNANRETIFDELSNFEKKKLQDVTPLLEDYLGLIAKTGNTIFPWMKLRPLFRHKMDKVITEFNVAYPAHDLPQSANLEKFDFDDMHVRLLKAVDDFSGTPFTIQRLCELVISPYKQYKRADKFMRALEKDLLVVSTIDPVNQRNKNDTDYSSLVNGVTVSTTSVNGTIESPNHSSSSSDDGSTTTTDENSKGSVTTSDDTTQSSSITASEPMESDLASLEAENPIPDSSSKQPDDVDIRNTKASAAVTPEEISHVTEIADKEPTVVIEEPTVQSPVSPGPAAVDEIPTQLSSCEKRQKDSESLSIVELPPEAPLEPGIEVSTAEPLVQTNECHENEKKIPNAVVFADEFDSSTLPSTTTATTVRAASEDGHAAIAMEAESDNAVVESSEQAAAMTPIVTDNAAPEVEKMDQD